MVPGRDDRRYLFVITALYGFLFLFFFGPRLFSDGANYFEFLHSLARDGDLNFADERAFFTPRYIPVFPFYGAEHQQTGYPANLFTIGPALFWLPGQLALSVVSDMVTAGRTGEMSSYSLASRFVATFMSCCAMLAGLVLLYRILRFYFSGVICLLTIVIILLTTHVPAFAFVTPAFSHAVGFFFVTLLLLSWMHLVHDTGMQQRRWLLFMLVGTSLGALSAMRLQGVFFAVIPAMHWVWHAVTSLHDRRCHDRDGGFWRLTAGYALSAVMATLVMLPQMISQLTIFGSLLADPQGSGGMHWTSLNVGLVLFHQTRGLFVVHPVLLPASLGLLLMFRKDRRLAAILLGALLLQFYINMVRRDWCGVGFGMRRFVETLPLMAFGAAALLEWIVSRLKGSRLAQSAGLIAILLAGLWNLLLMAQYYFGIYGNPEQTLRMGLAELVKGQWTSAPRLMTGFLDSSWPGGAIMRSVVSGDISSALFSGTMAMAALAVLVLTMLLFLALQPSSKTVAALLACSLVGILYLAWSLDDVRRNGRSLRIIPLLSLSGQASRPEVKSGILTLGPDTPFRGGLDAILFTRAGVFLRKVDWQYRMSPFLSPGTPAWRREFLTVPESPIALQLKERIDVYAIECVVAFSDIDEGPSDDQAPTLTIVLVSASGREREIQLEPRSVISEHTPFSLPRRWTPPAYPEDEGFLHERQSDHYITAFCYRKAMLTVFPDVTSLRLQSDGQGTLQLFGLGLVNANVTR